MKQGSESWLVSQQKIFMIVFEKSITGLGIVSSLGNNQPK